MFQPEGKKNPVNCITRHKSMKTALITYVLVDSASFMKRPKNAELLSESVKRLC